MVAWVCFVAIFLAFIVAKHDLTTKLSNRTGILSMYKDLSKVQDKLFVSVCKSQVRVQDCPTADLPTIFPSGIPSTIDFDAGKWMENAFTCNGFSVYALTKYCFTDCSKYATRDQG